LLRHVSSITVNISCVAALMYPKATLQHPRTRAAGSDNDHSL
jgi:hypothetical protein